MNCLFRKTDIKQLALIRILIGAWLLIDCIGMMLIGWMQEAYITSKMNFPFYGFEWIERLPPTGMYIVFTALGISALGIMLGYRYRLAVSLFFSTFLYVFMLDIVYDLNKFYLFLILTCFLLFIDAHRYWSLDVKYGQVEQSNIVPRWNLLLFQGLFALIYFYSGIAKINPDWIYHAEPLRTFFGRKALFKPLSSTWFEIVVYAFTYGGLLFDLSIAFLLMYRKSNFMANVVQATFHNLNFFLLGIGTLSIATALVTWVLFPTAWLKRKLSLQQYPDEYLSTNKRKKWLVGILMAFFFGAQLLVPHRHYWSGNNVNWTEKGHRFSWRLMSRTKSGSYSTFIVQDSSSGKSWVVNPKEYLTGRQYRKMSAETDLIIVFAHYLAEEWKKKGYDDVIVSAKVMVTLNGRPPSLLIDPQLDLTQCKRSFIKDGVSRPLQPRSHHQ